MAVRRWRRHHLAKVRECAGVWCLRRRCTGERTMATRILNEFLLFSGLAAFVTGIVLAAARLLI